MPTLSPKMKDKYVDDLLRARPQGPNHPQQKITYVKAELSKDWCYRSCEYKYKYELIPSHPTWGYTAEQIFSLDLMNRDDVDEYVRNRWFDGKSTYQLGRKKATVTRRINRIWERLEGVIRKVKRDGGVGIYNVRNGYYRDDGEFGNIYATSPEEAQRFADMFFGYLSGDKRLRVEFVRFGTPPEVISLNAKTIQDGAAKIQQFENKIEQLQKWIDYQRMRIETLSMIESQQLSAEDK